LRAHARLVAALWQPWLFAGVAACPRPPGFRHEASLHFVILQDILSFGFWVGRFFGNTIVWRGRRYYLYSTAGSNCVKPSVT